MFASFPTLLPFLLFAFVASITPRPDQYSGAEQQCTVWRGGGHSDHPGRLRQRCEPCAVGGYRGRCCVDCLAGRANRHAMDRCGVAELSGVADFPRAGRRDQLRPKNPVSEWGAAGLQWINPKAFGVADHDMLWK